MVNPARSLRSLLELAAFFVVLIACTRAAHAQSHGALLGPPTRVAPHRLSPFIIDRWTAADRAPEDTINAMVQTRDGFLWFGGFSGLARFDGVAFRHFTPGNTAGVTSRRIHSLLEDRHGTLWAGTEQDGVFMLRDGVFSAPSWNAQLPDAQVWTMTETRDGALWLGTNSGVARVDERGQVTTYTARDGIPSTAEVNAITEARDGTIWIGLWPGGIVRIGRDGIEPFRPAGIGQDALVVRIREDAAGVMWVGTSTGLFRITGEQAEHVPLGDRATQPTPRAIVPHPQGGLWLATDAGLWRLDGNGPTYYGVEDGLAAEDLRGAAYDSEGNLWVFPQAAALQRFKPRLATTYLPQSFHSLAFAPIAGDGAGGFWAGSACQGLWHFRDGVFEHYSANQNLDLYCVWGLHRDPDGTLWLGGNRMGLLRLADGRITVMPGAGDGVNAITRDRGGTLWIGTNGALRRLVADDTFESYTLPVPGRVLSVVERRAGGLWLGTTTGLYAFENGTFTRWSAANGLSHDIVRAVLEDAEGALWIGTDGHGLNRLKDGVITRYTTADGLFDETVAALLDDGRGSLWMIGSKGISRAARAELTGFAEGRTARITPVWYDTSDGLSSSSTSGGGQPAGWQAPDGRLWFPTASGLASIDPDAPRNAAPPPVALTAVVVDRHSQEPGAELTLPPDVQNLEIHYTGLSFVAPHKVQFRYRLAGYDDNWVEAGVRRIAYYTHLPPGRYRFEVQARNDAGPWSTLPAAIAVYQVPRFYQTSWFAALTAIVVVLAAAAAYRFRLRQLLRRTRQLEAMVGARTAEVVSQRNELAGVYQELVGTHEQLSRGHDELTKAHDNLLATLNQTSLGVCMVEGTGTVSFVSTTAQRLLGRTGEECEGRPWRDVLPLQDDDRTRVEALIAQSAAQRRRLPVRLESPDDRRYWMELDVRDDPRDPGRRILFLYDVTELYDLQRLLEGGAQVHGLIGDTAAMRLIYRQIRDVAPVDATVVIEGETGTGKELVARAIHDTSPRQARPFVAVNCAGLTESLLTSQLFGHRRGAFTGALADQIGVFEAASGGTLLLDEIGDIPLSVQAALLRVLQEREITRVGDSLPRKIDIRILAATHRDLQGEVAAGRFRQDLLYRLRVVRMRMPPLRDRQDDIPVLVAWFLAQARAVGQARVYEVSRAAMRLLQSHPWPGNVRELKATIESAAVAAQGPVIEVTHLPAEFLDAAPSAASSASALPSSPGDPSSDVLDARHRDHVERALKQTRGNRTAAARLLGVSRNTLYRRLRELGIDDA